MSTKDLNTENISTRYNLPLALTKRILNKTDFKNPGFISFIFGANTKDIPYSENEYKKMIMGAFEAFQYIHDILSNTVKDKEELKQIYKALYD